jgi:transcriptional regulator with XRE-family HTH domain
MDAIVTFSGRKLKELRKARGLTQTQLGQVVDRSTSDISNYENGFANPPSDVLLTLLNFFGIGPLGLGNTEKVENLQLH